MSNRQNRSNNRSCNHQSDKIDRNAPDAWFADSQLDDRYNRGTISRQQPQGNRNGNVIPAVILTMTGTRMIMPQTNEGQRNTETDQINKIE